MNFLKCIFVIFRKISLRLTLNLFICEYLDQSPSWMEMKEALSVELQTENLPLLKIKVKHNPGCPNKEYNAAFKNIHQNISILSRGKKTCIEE